MLVFTRANGHHLLPLPCSCYKPAAGATLQGLCRKGYAAHAPTAALATQIGMLQLLHWRHRSACPKCCTGHRMQPSASAALATQMNMLQVLHWQQGSAYSTCTAPPLLKGGRRTTRKRSKLLNSLVQLNIYHISYSLQNCALDTSNEIVPIPHY